MVLTLRTNQYREQMTKRGEIVEKEDDECDQEPEMMIKEIL